MIAAGGFAFVALFQLAIVLGAPLGPAAWGVEQTGQLPTNLRLGSAFATAFWTLAALTVLPRGGLARSLIPSRAAKLGTRVLVAVLAIGTLANIASSSNWERYGWAPLTLALTVVCFNWRGRRANPQCRPLACPDGITARLPTVLIRHCATCVESRHDGALLALVLTPAPVRSHWGQVPEAM